MMSADVFVVMSDYVLRVLIVAAAFQLFMMLIVRVLLMVLQEH